MLVALVAFLFALGHGAIIDAAGSEMIDLDGPTTIGTGVIPVLTPDPLVVFNHTLEGAAVLGVMTHFWTTGDAIVVRVGKGVLLEIFLDLQVC